MNWFGESWGAPCCDTERHVETPVGCSCVECDVPIGKRDQGFTSVVYPTRERISYHRICFLRTVIPCGMWTAEMLENMPEHWEKHREEKHP
jgi:hypothetical protein